MLLFTTQSYLIIGRVRVAVPWEVFVGIGVLTLAIWGTIFAVRWRRIAKYQQALAHAQDLLSQRRFREAAIQFARTASVSLGKENIVSFGKKSRHLVDKAIDGIEEVYAHAGRPINLTPLRVVREQLREEQLKLDKLNREREDVIAPFRQKFNMLLNQLPGI
jgi:hypothetical protein